MNRRDFLLGTLAVANITAVGGTIAPALGTTIMVDLDAAWQRALLRVLSTYQIDIMMYGTAALEYTDRYPYIRNVPYEEIFPPNKAS